MYDMIQFYEAILSTDMYSRREILQIMECFKREDYRTSVGQQRHDMKTAKWMRPSALYNKIQDKVGKDAARKGS